MTIFILATGGSTTSNRRKNIPNHEELMARLSGGVHAQDGQPKNGTSSLHSQSSPRADQQQQTIMMFSRNVFVFALVAALALASAAPAQKRDLPLIGNLFGGQGILGNLLGSNILGGILGGKGVAVAAAYSTTVFVHANVAANIAIDLPSQAGLLTPITGLLGGVLPLNSILGNVFATTTMLNVKSDVDATVSVGVCADIKVALPDGIFAVGTSNTLFGSAQVGVKIDVSANANVSATLVTPVLAFDSTHGTLGLLRLDPVTDALTRIACIYEQTTGRLVADLGAGAVSGTYIFVNIQLSV
ncbi:hypothetical protein PROFUN_07845 [Planoprotostelium fungivorum]|uniref:Uncharacterized protein n=1 Tax=Planoprotostelium fungivorum TaxID=1890364 RepID=A0A2P6NLB3_9EUKA|nr:hypothetical protein PROFUN_07839 [Planoprotostelium fungivorum]PRP84743.1 hypothetical protein PROFUN_07845 [Planoprotostelium fungivorum]